MTMQVIDGKPEPELTKAQIADLKMKHGDELLRIVESDGTYVFRSPSRKEYARYTGSLARKRDDLVTPGENLALDCLVYPLIDDEPDQRRLRSLFDKRPGLALSLANRLSEMAGASEDSLDLGKL